MANKPKPWLSLSAEALKAQINDKFPKRDKASDGWIGDSAHAARVSQHNPDLKTGCVRAIDIDADLDKKDKKASAELAERLRKIAKKDGRISYIIHQGRICSSTGGGNPLKIWKWRPYTGPNAHFSHIHISFKRVGDLNGRKFDI